MSLRNEGPQAAAKRLSLWKTIAARGEGLSDEYAELRRPATVSAGDLLFFADPEGPIGIWWVVVRPHRADAALWAIVPVDTVSMCGGADVSVRSGFGRLSARCGWSTWLHRDDVDIEDRVGVLDQWDLDRLVDKLDQVCSGEINAGLLADEADADPDLAEWLVEVAQTRFRLSERLQGHATAP